MKVVLRQNWFGPDGTLYRANRSPHQMPEDWRDQVPDSAEIDGVKEREKGADPQTDAKAEPEKLKQK